MAFSPSRARSSSALLPLAFARVDTTVSAATRRGQGLALPRRRGRPGLTPTGPPGTLGSAEGDVSLSRNVAWARPADEVAGMMDLQLGLQLYSVRQSLQRDAVGTLEKIAVIGYQHLQPAVHSAGT